MRTREVELKPKAAVSGAYRKVLYFLSGLLNQYVRPTLASLYIFLQSNSMSGYFDRLRFYSDLTFLLLHSRLLVMSDPDSC